MYTKSLLGCEQSFGPSTDQKHRTVSSINTLINVLGFFFVNLVVEDFRAFNTVINEVIRVCL